MRAAPVLVAVLLAGCVVPPAPERPPDAPPPATSVGPCASLVIEPERPLVVRGTWTTIALSLTNCGDVPLPLREAGRCTGQESMLLRLQHENATYTFHQASEGRVPEREDTTMVSFGPCPVEAPEPALLQPGETRTDALRWNGSAREMLSILSRGEDFTGHTGSFRLLWAPAGAYTLTAAYTSYAHNWSVAAAPVEIALVEPRRPDPDLLPGYTLWTAALPPLDATPPPPGAPQPGEIPPGAWLPENVQAAANESLARWLGEDIRRERVALVGWTYTPDCRLSTNVCDRWGWTEYYLLDLEMRIPELGETWPFATLPVRRDGLVVEDERWGYPDCVRVPAECAFRIDKTQAIALAKAAGLGETEIPIAARFTYAFRTEYPQGAQAGAPGDVYGTFAWRVQNHTTEDHGEAIWVDANDGRVLRERDRWVRPEIGRFEIS